MANAYKYEGQRLTVMELDGDKSVQKKVEIALSNQFAAEIDHMATCIIEKRKPRTPREEGVQDHVLMEAIYESARTGAPCDLKRRRAWMPSEGREPLLNSDGEGPTCM